MNAPGYPKAGLTGPVLNTAAVQLPSVASVMRDVARMTYAQHVKLAEALEVTPQALNEAVERHLRAPLVSASAALGSYFKESADG